MTTHQPVDIDGLLDDIRWRGPSVGWHDYNENDRAVLASATERVRYAMDINGVRYVPEDAERRVVEAAFGVNSRVTVRINVAPQLLDIDGCRESVVQDVRDQFWRSLGRQGAVPLYAPQPRWGVWGLDDPEQPTTPEEVSEMSRPPHGLRMHFCEMSAPVRVADGAPHG